AITARRGATIDHISQGRFGINLMTGWQKDEYAQMGLWPGEGHYQRRYQYAREYVDILKLLWSQRDVDYEGEFFHLRDCRILPHPEHPLPLVCAGVSDVGRRFTAQHADYAFVGGDLSGAAVFAANCKTVSSLGLRVVEHPKSHVQDLCFIKHRSGGKCQRNLF